jgi:hypothetical protein
MNTPRTDAHIKELQRNPEISGCNRTLDFARQLERELVCLKSRIEYTKGDDGMAWASMNWCVEVWSLAPATLDDAIEAELANNLLIG